MATHLLHDYEYIHVLNENNGDVRTIIGPQRVNLCANEKIVSQITKASVIYDNEYVIIKNPYDEETKKCKTGERKVIQGPFVLFLNYGEEIELTSPIHVLQQNEALRVQALQSHDDKPAGAIWQIEGPCSFVPNRFTSVIRQINPIIIRENTGIYVRNIETSQKKLVRGPCAYLLKAEEELYYKQYSDMERNSLKLDFSSNYWATTVQIEKGEVICVLDAEKNEHLICGPQTYMLDADETLKCLWLSAGKPKRPRCIQCAKIRIGPDFTSDKFEIRTKDNCLLSLLLTYKWEFLSALAEKNSKKKTENYMMFSMNDFIGYACTTMCSKIREEAAKYTFEEFHSNIVGIIRKTLFSEQELPNGVKGVGFLFDEINLLISEVDVKEITPVNKEISNLLNQSIKSNMTIVCKKLETEAELDAKKEKIKNSAELQKLKENLIEIQNKNLELETIEKAKIDGKVSVIKAQSKKMAEELKTRSKLNVELYKMKKIAELLNTEDGKKYLEMMKSSKLSKVKQQWFVSSKTNVDLF